MKFRGKNHSLRFSFFQWYYHLLSMYYFFLNFRIKNMKSRGKIIINCFYFLRDNLLFNHVLRICKCSYILIFIHYVSAGCLLVNYLILSGTIAFLKHFFLNHYILQYFPNFNSFSEIQLFHRLKKAILHKKSDFWLNIFDFM